MKNINNIISFFATVQNSRVLDLFDDKKNISISGSGNSNSKTFVFADVLRKIDKIEKVIWVVNDQAEQENVVRALKLWTDLEVFSYTTLPTDINNPKQVEVENRMRMIEFVGKLVEKKRLVVVTPYMNLMSNLPDIDEIKGKSMTIKTGEKVRVTDLFESLIERGYVVSSDKYLTKGTYYKSGEVLTVFPVNMDQPVRIDVGFDEVGEIKLVDMETGSDAGTVKKIDLIPAKYEKFDKSISDYFNARTLLIEDEVDIIDEFYDAWNAIFDEVYGKIYSMAFVSFNEDDENHEHLHFISVLKYRGAYDLANDIREKHRNDWTTIIFTKDPAELKGIFAEYNIAYSERLNELRVGDSGVYLVTIDKEDLLPMAFQNPSLRLAIITDKEISSVKEEKKKMFNQKVYLDFLTSLKLNDYVVHANHGIGKFLGLEKRTIDDITREYLKIGYAENDKLFVPIDQADKVNKYIGADEQPPKLTRLGSAEWNTITSKVKKETEIIAKELLQLYAERKSARGLSYKADTAIQKLFEEAFPYEETPGQLKAIADVKHDMERPLPMDRLVCGDVGFGKTEVAMRAAFKAVQNGKQVAFVSPITILADQHFRSLNKRMEGFDVRVDLMSRFRTASEQKETLKKLAHGDVDIVVGTHRLLQPDVHFKDLGLVIIDEEQRFGVKQKEALKRLKTEVDILTMTATPIPRTLNIALNKLRDISTITTPPPGRLPIITEVRRYSQGLIREAILRELQRGGQVYFLHNRVQTIDSVADKLRVLVPEAKFGVAHGKLGSSDLEERILAFKDHQFDVLVSSTIIGKFENV